MEVYLIRHAHAGTRLVGARDNYRPLSDDGFRQAVALVEFFADRHVGAVHSSPATRCVQTVEPLADALGLSVVEQPALWEDAALDDVFGLLDTLGAIGSDSQANSGIVFCTHGNLIPAVIERLAGGGSTVHGRGCERASVWMIRSDADRWVEARYFTPRSGYAG